MSDASGMVGGRGMRRLQLGLLTGALVTALVLLLWALNLFVGLRLRLTNLLYVPQQTSGDVVIVAIDENSIAEYGAYPDWSRDRYAQLVGRLAEDEARVIAFDILFAEPRTGDDELASALASAAENGTRVVLPMAGIDGTATEDFVVQFIGGLMPLPALAQHATHIAYVNAFPDPNGSIRHQMTTGEVDNVRHLSLPLATYLAYFNVSASLVPQVVRYEENMFVLPNSESLWLDSRGLWLQNYFGEPSTGQNGTFAVYSMADVNEGRVPPSAFADKVVLVGLMDIVGAVDLRPTPISNELMAGVEINANAVETLLTGLALRPESRLVQGLTIVVLGLSTGVLLAPFRWHGMIGVALLILFGWFLYASVVRFSLQQVVVNPLPPVLTVLFGLIISIGVRISDEVRQRQRVEGMLQSMLQISEQQMDLTRILPLVAQDLKAMTGAATGAIFVPNAKGKLETAEEWGNSNPALQPSSVHAAEKQATYLHDGVAAVPVIWQRRVSAVLAVQPPPFLGAQRASQQVERFAERLAANLENARLFGETQSQNQLLQGILSESPAGIIVLDDALNIQRYNESVAQWLNMGAEDFTGQPISAALEASSIDEKTWQTIGENLLAQRPFRQEVKANQRTYQLDAAHIPGGQRWVMTLSDITELAELSQLKTRMIRMASHDLKNPLGRIIGYGELLSEMMDDLPASEDTEQNKLLLGRIVTSAEEMNNIITEILSLEHIRAGRIQRESLSLANVVLNVVERHQPDAESKSQTLDLSYPDDLLLIRGDFNQLVQAMSNLVGNAIKYTPDGGQIQVRLCKRAGVVRLEVEDNGYGMAKEAQDNLFTEFYRVRSEKTKHIKGTGLGLSLVKAVVEAHEGKIWVESEVDQGSTFFVELPAAPETV